MCNKMDNNFAILPPTSTKQWMKKYLKNWELPALSKKQRLPVFLHISFLMQGTKPKIDFGYFLPKQIVEGGVDEKSFNGQFWNEKRMNLEKKMLHLAVFCFHPFVLSFQSNLELKIIQGVRFWIKNYSSLAMLFCNLAPPHEFLKTFSSHHEQLQPTISSTTRW